MSNTQLFDLCLIIFIFITTHVTLFEGCPNIKWWDPQTPNCSHVSFEAVLDVLAKEKVEDRMSLLAEECVARDCIQCQKDREGKWGERSVNNEVYLRLITSLCQSHVCAWLPLWVRNIVWGTSTNYNKYLTKYMCSMVNGLYSRIQN